MACDDLPVERSAVGRIKEKIVSGKKASSRKIQKREFANLLSALQPSSRRAALDWLVHV